MTFRRPYYRNNLRSSRTARTGTSRAFGWIKFLIFLVAIGVAIWFGFRHVVQDQLRDRVQAKIIEGLQPAGLVADLGQALFVEGQGIRLNNLSIRLADAENPQSTQSHLQIYEAFLHSPASFVELTSSELEIKAAEFRRAKLVVVRDASGNWDFPKIIAAIHEACQGDCEDPMPVSISDSEILLIDQSKSSPSPVRLTNVNLSIQPIMHEDRQLIQINGNVGSEMISNVEFTTYIDDKANQWHTTVSASKARISKDILAFLPSSMSQNFADLSSVAGEINLTGQSTGRMDFSQIPSFDIWGNVTGLSIDDSRLPFPIQETSAEFKFTESGFSISNANGRIGKGTFQCSYDQRGLLSRQQWSTRGNVKEFRFDHSPRMANWLPAYSKKFCAEYSPYGTSDIDFALTHDGQNLSRKIEGDLTNMAFTYEKLPYKTENCAGKVVLIDDNCDFDIHSFTSGQDISLKGFVRNLGSNSTFEMNISVPGELPIDKKMQDALEAQPKMAKVIRAFNGIGRVGGVGRIERKIAGGKIQKSFDVRLKQCSIRHSSFDYPIYNIEGLIQTRDSNFTFSNLSGNNSSGKVGCNGTWDPINGLDVRFLCSSVPLDDQLRFALKPEIREIWNGFRPRGTLDFIRVDMTLPIGKPIDLNIEAIMKDATERPDANYVSIHPVWFPYEIQHLAGTVNIGNNEVKLTNIKGKHQRTWIVCQGDGRYSDDSWSVRLKDMLVGSLQVDEDFLTALPAGLGSPVRQLAFQGLLNVTGEMTIAGRKSQRRPRVGLASYSSSPVNNNSFQNRNVQQARHLSANSDASTNMAWDLRFDMDQAKMRIGLPVENVFGSVTLVGQYDGTSAKSHGEVNIDSLTFSGSQITQVKGPIWIDESRAAAGAFASIDQTNSNVSPTVSLEQKRSLTGKMQKGTVNFDAQTTYGPQGKFFFQGTLADGCLATACREFAPSMTNVEGHSFAAVRMMGDYSGTHSYRGDGTIQLRDAKIYELPLFLSLLKILKIRQASRTAFDSSNIDFKIGGETIDFSRMEFIGDAVSLIGNGKMNLDRDIDLNFYSVMGRNRLNIPLISDLYRASSQKTLWINVNGTLDNPQTHRHVLPQLNDSLKQLFQPRDARIDQWARTQSSGGSSSSKPTFRR